MVDADIVYAKIGAIQRCLQRIRTVTRLDPGSLDNLDTQDIFVLNLQRAVQAALDLAAHVVGSEGLGVPPDLKGLFSLLGEAGVLHRDLVERMKKMAGFRNIAVHDYQTLQVAVLKSILVNHLQDLETFYTRLVTHFRLAQEPPP